jgi:hypothetical protein
MRVETSRMIPVIHAKLFRTNATEAIVALVSLGLLPPRAARPPPELHAELQSEEEELEVVVALAGQGCRDTNASAMMLSLLPGASAETTVMCTPTQLTLCAPALVGDASPTTACSEGRGEVDVANP